jgi:RNA polymerase sigma factor (TIGR02999 family)
MTDRQSQLDRFLAQMGGAADSEVERILPLVYAELRKLAARHLRKERAGHTLQATELVHEAYLRLAGSEELGLVDRNHVLATAAVAMRHVLIDHARKRRAKKRIDPAVLVPLKDTDESDSEWMEAQDHIDLLALDQALESLAELDARAAQVVELRYFGGFTEDEVAEILNTSKSTIAREWRAARLWLRREMKRGTGGGG